MQYRFDKTNLFFTSDIHFFHNNIIKYCNRPFSNIVEMNNKIVENWNSVVPKNGVTFILGDLSFGSENVIPELKKLIHNMNGRKILIPGNHDSFVLDKPISEMIEIFPQLCEISVKDSSFQRGKINITMCHYALKTWNKAHHGSWHLYGHSHASMPDDPNSKSMDVGIDTKDSNYTPYSYEKIKSIMDSKIFKSLDHHESI